VYRFDGLIEKAKPYAAEILRERQEAKNAKRQRSKPRLRAVRGGRTGKE
jgi:hypothetical protein